MVVNFYGSKVFGKHPHQTMSEGEEVNDEQAAFKRACALGELWGSLIVKAYERGSNELVARAIKEVDY